MNVGARSQFEGPAFGVHPGNRLDVGPYFVGEDAGGRTIGNFSDVQVEYFLVYVGINDEDVLCRRLNERVEVAIKGVLVAGFIDTLDFLLGEAQAEGADLAA